MKELRLKIKRENYNLFKELGDKQAGELIKGMCKKEIDEAKQNSLNGKKSAEAYAERQRRKQAMDEIGAIIGGMLSVAEAMEKEGDDDE